MYKLALSTFFGIIFVILLNVYLIDHFSDLKGANLFLLLLWVNLNVFIILGLLYLILKQIYEKAIKEKVWSLRKKLFLALLGLLLTPSILIIIVAISGKSSYLRVFTDETLKIYLQKIERFEKNVNEINLPPKAAEKLKKDIEELKLETQHLRELVRHQKLVLINFLLLFTVIALTIVFATIAIASKLAEIISNHFKNVIKTMERINQKDFSARLRTNLPIKELREFEAKFNEMVKNLVKTTAMLRREQELFRNVFNKVNTGVAIFDPSSGELIKANPSYHLQFGFKNLDDLRKWIKGKDLYRYEEKKLNNLVMVLVEDLTPYLIKRRYEGWKEIASQLAHDIKNPLHTLMLSYETLSILVERLRNSPPERKEFFEKKLEELVQRNKTQIEERILSITRMIDQFNNFLSEERELKREKFPLRQFLYELKRDFETENFKIYVEVEPVYVYADKEKLRRVFENLIKNSKEAIEGAGIKLGIVRIKNENNYIHITDNGPGIPPNKMDKLFLPFTSSKGKGRGLGLFIVKKLLEEHGWSIKVVPSEKGAHFVIEIRERDFLKRD